MSRRLGLNEWWAVEHTEVGGGWRDGEIDKRTLNSLRLDSIDAFNRITSGWDTYRNARRRGEVRCARVKIVKVADGRS